MSERWTRQEDNRLLFLVGTMPVPQLAQRLGRSERSILVRYRRDHGGTFMRATTRVDGMSAAECAEALGVNRQRVCSWIKAGWLKARERTVISRACYTVTEEDFESFIRGRAGLLEGLQPSQDWVEAVNESRADLRTRYVNRAELSSIFSLTPQMFSTGKGPVKAGFPPPAFTLCDGERWYERAAVRTWLETAPPRYRTARALRAFGLGLERQER